MTSLYRVFILGALVYLAWVLLQHFNSNLIKVRSGVNGRSYWVQNRSDKQQSADLLARVQQKIEASLLPKLPGDADFDRLKDRYNPDSVQENVANSSLTSYNESKGRKIVLCIRSKGSDEALLDENTVTFVFLHELAHLMTTGFDTGNSHSVDFWKKFKKLLQEASKAGVYAVEDYSQKPKPYCGILITENPLLSTDI